VDVKLGQETSRKEASWRYRCRWEDSIEKDLKEAVCERVEWIQVTHDRIQWWACLNTVINFQVA